MRLTLLNVYATTDGKVASGVTADSGAGLPVAQALHRNACCKRLRKECGSCCRASCCRLQKNRRSTEQSTGQKLWQATQKASRPSRELSNARRSYFTDQ